MLRVRIDGGALTTEQLRAIGEISQTYARDTADVTDRQNIQYHWIRIEDMPAIWERLESRRADHHGGVRRHAPRDPRLARRRHRRGRDDRRHARRSTTILERYIGDPAFSNLPRKFKTAISWQQDVAHEVNDVSFVGVVHPEHGPGFDLWVGGGLSTNPKIAQRLGAWVPLDEVPDVWAGVVSVFRDYGYRRLRHRARIKFLVADWGAEKFRQVLEDEYLHRHADRRPRAARSRTRPIDHVGVHKQRDGLQLRRRRPGRRAGSPAPRWSRWPRPPSGPGPAGPAHPAAEARRARRPGRRGRRCSGGARHELGLQAEPSPWRRATMACTGIEFCKLAIVETKERAIRLVERAGEAAGRRRTLDVPDLHPPQRLPELLRPHPGRGHRAQGPDRHRRRAATRSRASRCTSAAGSGLDAGFGRKLRGHKVTSAELGDYVERVVRRFVAQREAGERFAQWVARADERSCSLE